MALMMSRWGVVLITLVAGACSGRAFSSNPDTKTDAGIANSDPNDDDPDEPRGGDAAGGTVNGGEGGENTSGGSGAAGSNAGAGEGGSGGEETELCPAEEPVPGSPCDLEMLLCEYGTCCPNQAVCSGGKWLVDEATCEPPECPEASPQAGTACLCHLNLQCLYDQCAQGAQRLVVSCNPDGKWESSTTACDRTWFMCGNSSCLDGQVCVTTIAPGQTLQRRCVDDNPCGEQPVQCSCAASLCNGKLCSDTPGPNVLCGAP